MEEEQFNMIMKKIDLLIRLTALDACKGLSNDERAWMLHDAGLSSTKIGQMLGSNKNAIDQAIHRRKKSVGKARTKRVKTRHQTTSLTNAPNRS